MINGRKNQKMIYRNLIIATVISIAFGFGAWQVQDWKYQTKISSLQKETAIAHLKALEVSNAETIRINEQLQKAQHNAQVRQNNLITDKRKLDAELIRVRNASAEALLLSYHSHATCIERATILKDVFDSCSREYGELAKTTDRLSSDKQTLIEAWPTKE